MTSFPDLRNWEDEADKIQRASTAVRELRNYLDRQAAQAQAKEKAREKRQQAHQQRLKIQRSTTDRDKLRQELEEMHPQVGTQQGGYAFESWFYRMLDYFEVTSRRPYKAQGRQIDGALTVDGTTYLVETKFTAGQTTPAEIDTLKAKVGAMAEQHHGPLRVHFRIYDRRDGASIRTRHDLAHLRFTAPLPRTCWNRYLS